MNRVKALSILHEISEILEGTISFSQLSLGSNSEVFKNNDGYEIKMKCEFDKECWERVKPILKRNSLTLKVTDGFVIIS